jgi:hypothetical protein
MTPSKSLHLCLALLAALGATSASALEWSDDSFGYRYGATFREPGVVDSGNHAKDVAKSTLSYTHVDGYKLGGNFLNIDFLISSKADRAAGGGTGAAEVYVTYRNDLSLNKVTGGKSFSFGPVRDLSLETGIDLNTKNTTFASHKVMPAIGPAVAFQVPGFLNLAFLATREWNNNGIVGKAVTFDPTLEVSASWGIPVGPVSFAGFANVVLPKGKDGFGNETKTEVLLHPKILLDVGQYWGWKHGLEIGGGYQYWLNKFGNDHTLVSNRGSEESALFAEADLHL